jgi:hypothetical protein
MHETLTTVFIIVLQNLRRQVIDTATLDALRVVVETLASLEDEQSLDDFEPEDPLVYDTAFWESQ